LSENNLGLPGPAIHAGLERKALVKSSRLLLLSFASCLAVTTLLVAQSSAPPAAPPFAFVNVTTLTVKPAAVPDFESYVKRVNAGAAKIGVRQANWYAMGRGGPGFTYVVAVRFAKWSELDERPSVIEILNKAYGETEAARIQAGGRAAIESTSSVFLRVLPELSAAPSMETPLAHVRVTRVEVKGGTNSKFEAFVGKLKAAQEKAGGALPVIRYATAIGPANVYMAAYFFNKYAEFETAPGVPEALRKAYGEAEARMLEETSQACIKNLETHVLDYRADLSRPAAAK
jgi:hypothetical protein